MPIPTSDFLALQYLGQNLAKYAFAAYWADAGSDTRKFLEAETLAAMEAVKAWKPSKPISSSLEPTGQESLFAESPSPPSSAPGSTSGEGESGKSSAESGSSSAGSGIELVAKPFSR